MTPGEVLTLVVGAGGTRATGNQPSAGGGGFGKGGDAVQTVAGGSGGGGSAILRGTTPLVVAGGGGGGGGSNDVNQLLARWAISSAGNGATAYDARNAGSIVLGS